MENYIYYIGFIVVLIYIIFGIDDLVWDIFAMIKVSAKKEKIDIAEIDYIPPKLLAIMIAAWKEDAVIADVVDNIMASVHYPKSMYYIFLGVYSNDAATIAKAKELENRHENVHMVIDKTPGPTCKADNINNIIRHIKNYEKERGWKFASFTVHDSEDVVHPYELKVTNYLINKHDALQFPVFPLQEMPKFNNFLTNLTTGTYADEFAENHYRNMVMRDTVSAIVPSAGTGFVLSRKIIDHFKDKDVFPENSLTEDYKLSITLATLGFKVHYVLEKVSRLRNDGKISPDYISTRSMFPSTFATAVRQKTRWIYGITMQSVKPSEIFTLKNISFLGRYSLYKDLKANIGNLIILPGYFLLVYFLLSLFIPLEIMFPKYSPSWWLSMGLTLMMIERQFLRIIAVKNVYGWRSVFLSCLLPPILPIRLLWGNIINMTATINAWKNFFSVNSKPSNIKASKSKPKWNKTDHEFLEKGILKRYHRNLGDVLLEKEYIDKTNLEQALDESKQKNVVIGKLLIEKNYLTESELINALANVKQTIMLDTLDICLPNDMDFTDYNIFYENIACPIIDTNELTVIAMSYDSKADAQILIESKLNKKIEVIYAPKDQIFKCLSKLSTIDIPKAKSENLGIQLFNNNKINWQQYLISVKVNSDYNIPIESVLKMLGLYNEAA